MLTHDNLIFAVQQLHPALVHGRDFWVAQQMLGDTQIEEACVVAWLTAEAAQPDHEQLREVFEAHKHKLAPTIDDLKRLKTREIERGATGAITALTDQYPDYEIATWSAQSAEAHAWASRKEGETVATPYCDVAAAARGISKDEFVKKVLEKQGAYLALVAEVSAKKSNLLKRVEKITQLAQKEELDAIVW